MHTLPALPYSFDALEPYIDVQTMQVHYTKHHATYLAKLNDALEKTGSNALMGMDIAKLLRNLNEVSDQQRSAVRNNGGGHYNHSLFWQVLGPGKGGKPTGDLAQAIDRDFGSFEKFKELFENEAVNRFGSGWAWLYVSGGKLKVGSTPNQDNPIIEGTGNPLLGLDVWEHAYYLKYQNRRAEYAKAFWNIVDWDAVAQRL